MVNEGGFTEFRKLTPEDSKVFEQLKSQFPDGIVLVAKEVATQVVHGINYRFKCVQTYLSPQPGAGTDVLVEAYLPITGKPELKAIIPSN